MDHQDGRRMRSVKRVIWCFLLAKIAFSNGWMALDGWTRGEWELERQMPNERSRLSLRAGGVKPWAFSRVYLWREMPPCHVNA
jgi:hypothetical protein